VLGVPAPVKDWPVPDWAVLREAAAGVVARAYAPYSGLMVGAAGLCDDGHVVTGCNVENASFGLTLCAECGLVSALVAHGRNRLVAVSVVAADGRPLAPCGRCRQVLIEHGGPELLVDGGPAASPQRLGDLLPGAFDRSELEVRRGPGGTEPAHRARVG
jgi:cytidine deaminase